MSNYSLPSAPLLLLVTDRTRYGDRSLEDIFVPALTGGVNMIEVREADMTARDLLGEAERFRKLVALADALREAWATRPHCSARRWPPERARTLGTWPSSLKRASSMSCGSSCRPSRCCGATTT